MVINLKGVEDIINNKHPMNIINKRGSEII